MTNKIEKITLTTDLQQVVSADQAWHYKIIPFATNFNLDSFYTLESENHESLKNELSMVLGKTIVLE